MNNFITAYKKENLELIKNGFTGCHILNKWTSSNS